MEQAILASPSVLINPRFIGDLNGIANLISGGPGKNGGIGTGDHNGIGPREGQGAGDGPDGIGIGGVQSGFRDDVTQAILISKTEPDYSEDARKARLQGSVLLRIVVNERGRAESIVVTQSLGLGLDERAIEAVKKWKFRPGMRGKTLVPTSAIIQVTFRLL